MKTCHPKKSRLKSKLGLGLLCLLTTFHTGVLPVYAQDQTQERKTTLAQLLSVLRPELNRASDKESLTRAREALKLTSELKLPQASKSINEALQIDPRNSYLHFFNGLIYHLQARQGDTDKTN